MVKAAPLALLRYHLDEFGSRVFDFGVAVLVSSGFSRKHPAAMSVFEIAIGEFVSSFCILGISDVDAQMPFCILTESTQPNELILCYCRRVMFAPRSPAVRNDVPLLDKFFSVLEGANV